MTVSRREPPGLASVVTVRRFDNPMRPSPVLYTRGAGCAELAELLSIVPPVRVKGNLHDACVEARTDLVVSKRLSSSLDTASQVVPYDFDPDATEHVVAAVSGGPHSPLAARIARRLGEAMGAKSLMVCAYHDEATHAEALSLIERLYEEVPGLEYRTVEADDAAGLVEQLPEQSALVVGAPGGSWLQRTFFGQGARLRQSAPAGALVARTAPERVFQAMGDPIFVGTLRECGDILRVHSEEVLAVADRAVLVGVIDRETLERSDPSAMVHEVMSEPVSVPIDAPLSEALPLFDRFAGGAIPVTNEEGYLVGGLMVPAEGATG